MEENRSQTQLSKEEIDNIKAALNLQIDINEMEDTFEHTVLNQSIYVDKSMILKQILNKGHHFITAPSRWGKSINISMIRSFLQPDVRDQNNFQDGKFLYKNNKNRILFAGGKFQRNGRQIHIPTLKIFEETQLVKEYLGQHPVIYLNFKSVSSFETIQELQSKIGRKISKQFNYHDYLINYELKQLLIKNIKNGNITDRTVKEVQKMECYQIREEVRQNKLQVRQVIQDYIQICDNNFTKYTIEESIEFLAEMIFGFFKKRVFVLIDEFDKPVLSLIYQYIESIGKGEIDQQLKIKDIMFKAARFVTLCIDPLLKPMDIQIQVILTGIINTSFKIVSTEASNLMDYNSLTCKQLQPYFGFTDEEIDTILKKLFNPLSKIDNEKQKLKQLLKFWYNGYNISGKQLYNPNSIMKYIYFLLIQSNFQFKSYWINTFHQNLLKLILDCSLQKNFDLSDYLQIILSAYDNKPQKLNYEENQSIFNLIENFDFKKDSFEILFSHILIKYGFLTQVIQIDCEYPLYRFPSYDIQRSVSEMIRNYWFKNLGLDKQNQIAFENIARTINFYSDDNIVLQNKLEQLCQIYFSQVSRNINERAIETCLICAIRISSGFYQNKYITEEQIQSGDGFLDFDIFFKDRVDIYELKYKGSINIKNIQGYLKKAMVQIVTQKYKEGVIESIKFEKLPINWIRLIPMIFFKKNNDHKLYCRIGIQEYYSIKDNKSFSENEYFQEVNRIQQQPEQEIKLSIEQLVISNKRENFGQQHRKQDRIKKLQKKRNDE